MDLLESIPIKRSTLTSNLELSWCIIALTQSLMSIDKPLTTWLSLVSLPCKASEWASPAFFIPKKDGHIRKIKDLCSLNKTIICKQYPLPIITDMLDCISSYKFFTQIDISMQYYTFELDEPSQELCVIVMPFGKYKYKNRKTYYKCMAFLVLSTITDACGLSTHTSWHLSPASPERKLFTGLQKWTLPSNT